jgi:hypothetical protein
MHSALRAETKMRWRSRRWRCKLPLAAASALSRSSN